MTPRKTRQHEQGFTLAFTIILTVVLSLAAVAIMTKVFVSVRQSGFTKERQNTMDAAVMGLNMALDEISPGLERMRNVVWTSSAESLTPTAGMTYPRIAFTQTQVRSNGTTANSPVRELSLVGNIRNWEAFANWGTTNVNDWNKGWVYVPNNSSVQYFDAAPGGTGRARVMVGNQATTGAYWYDQINPKPPVLADGAPDVPTLPGGTKMWPNARGGTYGNEYQQGLFWQPVLRKVYQVRQNPLVRVAVYVRMSLQDYYGPEATGSTVVYNNVGLDGRTVLDADTTTYDKRNFLESNAVTFSVFAVSEGTGDSKGVRIHQALNVNLGGAEYISGLSARTSEGQEMNANGLENANRLSQLQGTTGVTPPYQHRLTPYFAPTLDTPGGNNQLTAYAPITGQVYPASADLSFNFSTRPATEQSVFLYEQIRLAGNDDANVVFLIEQIPTGVSGRSGTYWRRRLLFDRRGYSSPRWDAPSGVGYEPGMPMMFNDASFTINPITTHTAAFPSMLWWGNKRNDGGAQISLYQPEEHFYNNTMTRTDANRYPFTTRMDRFGVFSIGTQSAGDFGVAAGNSMGDVITWPNNPLVDFRGGRLAANMPWQGPTVPISTNTATVSYVATTWPKQAWSAIWAGNGGGVGLPFTAATWSVY